MPSLMTMLFAAIVALQVADAITTVIGIRRGIASEANPVLAPLFRRFGALPVMLAVKAALIAGVLLLAPNAHPWALWVLAAIYGYIVVNNVRVLSGSS